MRKHWTLAHGPRPLGAYGAGPGPPMDQRLDAEEVIQDAQAAGLSLLSHETFLPYQFLLVFGLDSGTSAPTDQL